MVTVRHRESQGQFTIRGPFIENDKQPDGSTLSTDHVREINRSIELIRPFRVFVSPPNIHVITNSRRKRRPNKWFLEVP
jgi:hypothetical protein